MDSTLPGRQRGGQRPGSGRKRLGEAKKTVRIKISYANCGPRYALLRNQRVTVSAWNRLRAPTTYDIT